MEMTPNEFCPYINIGVVSWTGGWCWTGPHSAHGGASAWRLHGAGLGSWRLDGPHVVSARKDEAEALHEALSLSSWRDIVVAQRP
jgi:hypothetical protein